MCKDKKNNFVYLTDIISMTNNRAEKLIETLTRLECVLADVHPYYLDTDLLRYDIYIRLFEVNRDLDRLISQKLITSQREQIKEELRGIIDNSVII